MLLFTVSYAFSNLPKIRAALFSVGFGVASVVAGLVCLLSPFHDSFTIFRVAAFLGLAVFCFVSSAYSAKTTSFRERWYVAVQPAAIFVMLFIFFNRLVSNSGTSAVWAPYLMDVFGITFAILIILYFSSLFTWATVGLLRSSPHRDGHNLGHRYASDGDGCKLVHRRLDFQCSFICPTCL